MIMIQIMIMIIMMIMIMIMIIARSSERCAATFRHARPRAASTRCGGARRGALESAMLGSNSSTFLISCVSLISYVTIIIIIIIIIIITIVVHKVTLVV